MFTTFSCFVFFLSEFSIKNSLSDLFFSLSLFCLCRFSVTLRQATAGVSTLMGSQWVAPLWGTRHRCVQVLGMGIWATCGIYKPCLFCFCFNSNRIRLISGWMVPSNVIVCVFSALVFLVFLYSLCISALTIADIYSFFSLKFHTRWYWRVLKKS